MANLQYFTPGRMESARRDVFLLLYWRSVHIYMCIFTAEHTIAHSQYAWKGGLAKVSVLLLVESSACHQTPSSPTCTSSPPSHKSWFTVTDITVSASQTYSCFPPDSTAPVVKDYLNQILIFRFFLAHFVHEKNKISRLVVKNYNYNYLHNVTINWTVKADKVWKNLYLC